MASDGEVTITWLGHAATRIDTPGGKVLLIDPFLQQNPATPEALKNVERVDLMLITHGHSDHMADAVPIAQRTNCDVIAIYEIASYLESKGVKNTTGMNQGGTLAWKGLEITLVPAVHSSTIAEGDVPIDAGTACGFVVRFENGFVVYHAGDTALFDGFNWIGRLYEPDVALLPIGDHFTMGPRQAAEAIRMLGVHAVIPIHYGTFPVLTGTPEGLRARTNDIPGLTILDIKPGESVTQRDVV